MAHPLLYTLLADDHSHRLSFPLLLCTMTAVVLVSGGESLNSGLSGPEKEMNHWAVHRIFLFPFK